MLFVVAGQAGVDVRGLAVSQLLDRAFFQYVALKWRDLRFVERPPSRLYDRGRPSLQLVARRALAFERVGRLRLAEQHAVGRTPQQRRWRGRHDLTDVLADVVQSRWVCFRCPADQGAECRGAAEIVPDAMSS